MNTNLYRLAQTSGTVAVLKKYTETTEFKTRGKCLPCRGIIGLLLAVTCLIHIWRETVLKFQVALPRIFPALLLQNERYNMRAAVQSSIKLKAMNKTK